MVAQMDAHKNHQTHKIERNDKSHSTLGSENREIHQATFGIRNTWHIFTPDRRFWPDHGINNLYPPAPDQYSAKPWDCPYVNRRHNPRWACRLIRRGDWHAMGWRIIDDCHIFGHRRHRPCQRNHKGLPIKKVRRSR